MPGLLALPRVSVISGLTISKAETQPSGFADKLGDPCSLATWIGKMGDTAAQLSLVCLVGCTWHQ